MAKPIDLYLPILGGPSPADVAAAEATLAAHAAAVAEQKSNALVRCGDGLRADKHGCGVLRRVGELTYIQTHWRTGQADYWVEGEGNFICPSCNYRTRLTYSPSVEALKPHFKTIVNEKPD